MSLRSDALDPLQSDLERVRRQLATDYVQEAPPALSAWLARLIQAGGKLLRPQLVCLVARLAKPAARPLPQRIYQLAAGIEAFHIATLIHDDIVDNSPLRRGQPTLHVSGGIRQAVLSGDYLFSKSVHTASLFAGQHQRQLAAAAVLICRGELAQLPDDSRDSLSLRAYFRRIGGKTAALFSLAAAAAARAVRMPLPQQSALRRAAWCAGLAFQITDDILDLTAVTSSLGKPSGADFSSGLLTLPAILACRALGSTSFEDSARMHQAILSSNAVAGASAVAQRFLTRALKTLESLPAGQPRNDLAGFFQTMVQREK